MYYRYIEAKPQTYFCQWLITFDLQRLKNFEIETSLFMKASMFLWALMKTNHAQVWNS